MNSFSLAGTDPGATSGMPDTSRLAIEPGVSAPSQLGSSIRIEGEIYAEHDLFVDGEVNGNVIIPNHKISIGPNANVKANVKAKNVVVVGTLEGNIEAGERIELRSKSNLVGDVRGARVQIEHGAFIKGSIEVVRQPATHDPNAL